MITEPPEERPAQGPPILVTHRELIKLSERMTRMEGKLDAALPLPAKIEHLEARVTSLETERAVRNARGGVFGKAWDIFFALILAFIATGVWFR